jgi:hypothetical protein
VADSPLKKYAAMLEKPRDTVADVSTVMARDGGAGLPMQRKVSEIASELTDVIRGLEAADVRLSG